MKILVTGGSGFIGGNFVRYVLRNTASDVINVDALTYAAISPTQYEEYDDRYIFYKSDIGDNYVNHILDAHRPDYIINFAAETHVDNSINDPHSFVKTNVLSTYNFICGVQEYYKKNEHVRFLHVSTDEVYGQLNYDDPTFTEKSPYAPNSPYSATKASSDHLVRAFHHTYGLPAIITNCSNNYGPYQHTEKLIPKIISNALQNKPVPIYGTGLNIRDWLYVEDHCEALYNVLINGKIGGKYNIGGKTEVTNLFVATAILSLLNKPIDLINFVEDRKGHDFRYAINTSHIEKELGWYPKHTFEIGLQKTIEWYLENGL
jgi:dTDP-glucose 4,6-dehydratase